MREHIEADQKEEIFVSMELSDSRKEELITILSKELVVLRAKSGVSQDELSKGIGISRQTYQAIESGKRRMTWRTYLAVLLFFDYNPLIRPTTMIAARMAMMGPQLGELDLRRRLSIRISLRVLLARRS